MRGPRVFVRHHSPRLKVSVTDFLPDRVLYTPERLEKIAQEAVKANSAFTLEDRIGLVYDALALTKAGYLNVSSVLSLYDILRHEKECKPCFQDGDM